MSGSIKKPQLDRKEQETWRKQNNTSGIFYKTGYGTRGQQDVERRMWRRLEGRKDGVETSRSYVNSSDYTWPGLYIKGGNGAHRNPDPAECLIWKRCTQMPACSGEGRGSEAHVWSKYLPNWLKAHSYFCLIHWNKNNLVEVHKGIK